MEEPGDCQLEPKTPEVELFAELLELATEEEDESPKVEPELKVLDPVAEEANREPPEEKAVFPANPNEGDDADEPK